MDAAPCALDLASAAGLGAMIRAEKAPAKRRVERAA